MKNLKEQVQKNNVIIMQLIKERINDNKPITFTPEEIISNLSSITNKNS